MTVFRFRTSGLRRHGATRWHPSPANRGCVQEIGRHDNKEVHVVMT